jgi:Spy/CpxP family protein refolding chaperone
MLARSTRSPILALAAFALSSTLGLAQPPAAPAAPDAAPAPAAAPIERQPPSDGMHPEMRRPGMRPGGMRPGGMQDRRDFHSHDMQGRGNFRGGDFHGGMMGGGFRGGPEGTWWKNSMLVQRIGLTPDQVKRMDGIFQQNRIQLIDLKANVEKQEVLLEPLLSANPPDIARATAQIDKVADARADLEKSNAKMLLGIRGVLTPDQWTRLHEHRGFGGPGGPDGGPQGPPAPAVAPAGRTRGLRPSGSAPNSTPSASKPPTQ